MKILNANPLKILTLAIVFAGGLLSGAPTADAQTNLPGFVVPKQDSAPPLPMLNLDAQSFSSYETAFLKLRNKKLSDTLLLQYQISLLKILLERQAEIDNIASSFEKLGIKFNQPAPDKTICERLPENLLCMLFYPEMFDIDIEAYTNPQPAFDMSQFLPTNTANTAPTNNTPAPASIPEPEPEPEEITTPYLWSDIQCAISVCKVVLLDRRNPGKAYTVRSGHKMPDDSIVAEISYNGVKVNKKGEILTVEPAPANGVFGGGEDTGTEGGAVRGIFESVGMDNDAGDSATSTTTNEAASSSNTDSSLFDTVPEPAQSDEQFTSDFAPAPADEPSSLGPTGLF